MALVTLPNVDSKFATGQPAYGTDITGNVNALLADYNGNITNANCSASMALADSKLAQITTAGKVHGTSITGLASLPSGAGVIPAANLPSNVLSDIILRGFELVYTNTTTVIVNSGALVNGTTLVTKTENTTLTIGTAGNWYDGATHTYGSGAGWNYIGVDNAGNIKFLFTNAPSKADVSANTAGTLIYYPNGATYYRVIGAVWVHTDNTITRAWFQSKDYIAWDIPLSMSTTVSNTAWTDGSTLAKGDCSTLIPAISIRGLFGCNADGSSVHTQGINIRRNGSTFNNSVANGVGGNATVSGGASLGASQWDGELTSFTDASQKINYYNFSSGAMEITVKGYYLNIR